VTPVQKSERVRRSILLGPLISLTSLLGLLTACTPADVPIVALSVHDGQPIGILVACSTSSQLSVYEADDRDDRTLISWRVSGEPTAGTVVEIPLLGQPPDGWQVVADSVLPGSASSPGDDVHFEQLTELKPGVRYSIGGYSRYHALPVDFTTSDFARIGPGKVLAPKGHRDTKLTSEKDFVSDAGGHCD
jgi:hypothetical protein